MLHVIFLENLLFFQLIGGRIRKTWDWKHSTKDDAGVYIQCWSWFHIIEQKVPMWGGSYPAGCTYLCQPIHVGINKTIQCGMREKWEDWMLKGEGIIDEAAKELSWKLIVEWLINVYHNISRETVQNAWLFFQPNYFSAAKNIAATASNLCIGYCILNRKISECQNNTTVTNKSIGIHDFIIS